MRPQGPTIAFVFIPSSLTLYLSTWFFGAVYATKCFHWDTYILLFIVTYETYLSIFGNHGGSSIYPYLSLENVWFIYFTTYSFLLIDSWFYYNMYLLMRKLSLFWKSRRSLRSLYKNFIFYLKSASLLLFLWSIMNVIGINHFWKEKRKGYFIYMQGRILGCLKLFILSNMECILLILMLLLFAKFETSSFWSNVLFNHIVRKGNATIDWLVEKGSQDSTPSISYNNPPLGL